MTSRVRTVFGALAAAGLLAFGWRAQGFAGLGHPWRDRTTPMDGTTMGPGMERPDLPWTDFTVPAALAIAVVLTGIVLLRRRPLAGYVVGIAGLLTYGVLGGPSVGMYAAALVLAIGLLRARGLTRAAPWWGLLVLGIWSTWWDQPALGLTDWRMWSTTLTNLLWVLVPALLVALAMNRRHERARDQAEALERAASDERLRIAREIHDVVGHSLSMISLQSAVALRVLDADPAQARTSLEAIRSSSKDALAELRHTLGVFRGDEESGPLAPTPTVTALPGLVADVRASGVPVTLDPLPDATDISAAVQATAYRVVQEALTNAVRHAPGRPVHATVSRHPGEVRVAVTNPAIPGLLIEGGGLRGMRERVDALGGTLRAGNDADAFVVDATLPLEGP